MSDKFKDNYISRLKKEIIFLKHEVKKLNRYKYQQQQQKEQQEQEMRRKQNMPSPFVKWAGGKRQIITSIEENLPSYYERYVEPFVGGGAVMFYLNPDEVDIIVNDYNSELINVYETVRDHPIELMDKLDSLKGTHSEEQFYEIRAWDRESDFPFRSNIERAARFIYLNKTGFNGLHRVNSKGYFNVPSGKYKNPELYVCDNILKCSKHLQKVKMTCKSFEDVVKSEIGRDTFFYFDPPYVPKTPSASFDTYTAGGFGKDKQILLKEMCDEIDAAGGKFMVSNSDVQFVRDLYEGYYIMNVQATRAINSKSNGRGKINEVFVKNYR